MEEQRHRHLLADVYRFPRIHSAGKYLSLPENQAYCQLGVTSTNHLVDIVEFFGQNVYADLQAAPGSVHPILIVDAIKFLYTFRSQASGTLFSRNVY